MPSPCGVPSKAFSVNAFRWRIRDEQLGDALKNSLGTRDPKRIGRVEW